MIMDASRSARGTEGDRWCGARVRHYLPFANTLPVLGMT